MMGSLLTVNGGELAFGLPVGVPRPENMSMGGMNGGGSAAKTVTVHIKDFLFDPDPVPIKAGDTVNSVWDANDHSTTSDKRIWDSGGHNSGFSFSRTFPTGAGFPGHCAVHGGAGSGMQSTVVANT